jgi:hypothetical protein
MQMNRGNVTALQEKIGSGNNLYIKGKDFATPRRVRPIIWLRNGQPCDVLTYLEGWHTVSQKDSKGKVTVTDRPVRFNSDETIPDTYTWKVSSYMGGKPTAQSPKPNIALLVWDYTTKSIKVATFHQVTVVTQISGMLAPSDKDGNPNELFVDDLTKVDFVIKQHDDEKNYTITTQAPKGGENLTKECLDALKDFEWSWDAFMACEKIEDSDSKMNYADVVDIITSGDAKEEKPKKEQAKQENKTVKKEVDETETDATFNYNKDWKKVKTPKGRILGEQSVDDLTVFKDALEERGKTENNPLYDAVLSGIQDLTDPQGDDAEF